MNRRGGRRELVYWPSFEFATAEDVFKEDGRDLPDEVVDRIVGGVPRDALDRRRS